MTKPVNKIVGLLLLTILILNSCKKGNHHLNGTFVSIEDMEEDFYGEFYGYLIISNDTITLNSYSLPYDLLPNKKVFVRRKGSDYQNPQNKEAIAARLVNDSIVEVDFEGELHHKYIRIEDRGNGVDYDFKQKKFRYQLGDNSYTIEFNNDDTAIGINEASLDSVNYTWKKIKLANHWFIVLSNNLYSYHLRLDSIVGRDVLLSRFLDNTKQIEFIRIDVDGIGNSPKTGKLSDGGS